jgi:uncharacterized RDD family membrane protein YckC
MDTLDPVTEAYIPDAGHYPQLVSRVKSTIIDVVLIIVSLFVITWVLDQFTQVPDWVRVILFIGIWLVYEPLATTLGCTLGNYIAKIRVRRESNESKRINLLQAYVRFIIKIIFGWLSFWTILFIEKKRALHDIVPGTVVIGV